MSWNSRFSSLCSRMRSRAEQGSAALEFAFIAPVFFALMLSILQIGIMTFGQVALQNSVTQAARLIRTGQAAAIDPTASNPACVGSTTMTTYGTSQKWFNGQVCCNVTPLLDCSKLQITVKQASSFGAGFGTYTASPSGDSVNDPATTNYAPGTVCDIVLVRATYPFPIWFPGLSQLLNQSWTYADAAGGNIHTLAGTAAFRNEPYNSSVSGC